MLGFFILKQKMETSLPQIKESYANKPTCIWKFGEDTGIAIVPSSTKSQDKPANINELHRKITAIQDSRLKSKPNNSSHVQINVYTQMGHERVSSLLLKGSRLQLIHLSVLAANVLQITESVSVHPISTCLQTYSYGNVVQVNHKMSRVRMLSLQGSSPSCLHPSCL